MSLTSRQQFKFDPDYFDIDASVMKQEATLHFVYKRVYIFLVYNCAF